MKKFVENIIRSDQKRLFCFPYAGGGPSIYKNWNQEFSDMSVYAMQYPGKEKRIAEKPINNVKVLVEKMAEELYGVIKDCPFVLFGHSLGTKVAYELALKLFHDLGVWPEKIIVSGGRAPALKEQRPIYHLKDEEFIRNIVERYSSIPEELASNKEIMDVFLPSIRADFVMDETYKRSDVEKVGCPILGLMGSKDQEMILEDLLMWENFTEEEFTYRIIEGNHMFINHNFQSVRDTLCFSI